MSIHGILAALLGSSALGGYAPLTLLRAHRYYLTGLVRDGIAPVSAQANIFSGLEKNKFYVSNVQHHTAISPHGFVVGYITQNIILGFTGMLATNLDLHSLLQDPNVSGWGARYGASYGG